MTGREIFSFALKQMGSVTADSIEPDANKFSDYLLETVNFCAASMYYWMNRNLPTNENVRRTIQDLPARSDEGSVVPLLGAGAQIRRVSVKFADTDPFRRAEYINLTASDTDEEVLREYQSQSAPLYTRIGDNVLLFPRPETTVKGGVKVYQTLPYSPLTKPDDVVVGLPGGFHEPLHYLVKARVYERLEKEEFAIINEQRYEKQRQEFLDEIIGSIRTSVKTTTKVKQYI